METVSIKNRKGLHMTVDVKVHENQKGVVFVMHGLGGWKDQPHIQLFGNTFEENGFTVVWFDTTNSFNTSEGKYEDATTTGYYEDLEDVIQWASGQEWYQEPFALCGHSLGSISITLYAEQHPEKVLMLAPTSTVVSGQLSLESPKRKEIAQKWKETGWSEEKSTTVPGRVKRLPWSHMEDRLQYNTLDKAGKLTMPVLMIVGSEDKATPLEHQKLLFEKLPGEKELHVIQDAPHTFTDKKQLDEIHEIMSAWVKKCC